MQIKTWYSVAFSFLGGHVCAVRKCSWQEFYFYILYHKQTHRGVLDEFVQVNPNNKSQQ